MKIIFNTDQIYKHGGIEKVMATKANYFAQLPNTKVIILTVEQQNRAACYSLDSRIQLIDLDVNYNRKKTYFSRENIRKAISHFSRQSNIIKVLDPDFIISPNYNFDHYWLPFIKPKKSILIKEVHSSGFINEESKKRASLIGKFKMFFNEWIMSKYQSIVVLNEDEKQYQTTNNIFVIPNPVVLSPYLANLKNKQVIAAGRIAPVKGFNQLIKAWSKVHKINPDWSLHIYGDDYENTKVDLENDIALLDLKEVVLFKNTVSDIPRTMLDYSIYAMSSLTECFPMVLLEAQSVGLPIVSYDCPNGPRHIVNHDIDGLLVRTQNIADLADSLLMLIEDYDLRLKMGLNAKENSINFSTEKVMSLWLNMFHNLKTNKV